MRFTQCLQMVAVATMVFVAAGCTEDNTINTNNPDNEKPDTEEPNDKPDDKPDYPSSTAFAFENIHTEHTKISLDIIPEDKTMEYVVFVSEVKHFGFNSIDTPEELFEDDYVYFGEYATEYNMTIREFLSAVGWLTTGDKHDYGAINLYPATDYVVYCYGVKFEGANNYTPVTDIAYTVIRTTAPATVEAKFDVTTEVNGNVATFDIKTNGYTGLYYHYIVDDSDLYYVHEGMELTEEYIAHYRNRAMEEFNTLINDEGYSPSNFCHTGDMEFTERLVANTNYMIILFAVSDDRLPLLCSTPTFTHFSTGEPYIKDMTFDIEVSDITPYYAVLDITPSTDEEYACVFLSADQLPNSGDEFTDMDIIIEYYQPAILTGAHHETLTPLMPSTEYVVVAFGIEDNLPTSHMHSYRFTSDAADKGTVNITDIAMLKLYDAKEILALDRSYATFIGEAECVAVVEATLSAATDTFYFWWYEEWHKIEYNDEVFLEDLLMYEPANNPEVMQMWYSMDENDKFFFAGIAEDENGNLGDIYYGDTFLLTKDMTSPAEEFIAWDKDSN